MNSEYLKKQEEVWKDIVIKGEMLNIKLLTEEAKQDLEKRISDFLKARKNAMESNLYTFQFRNKIHSVDEKTKAMVIRTWANTQNINKRRALLAYRKAETNAWIYKTLLDKKKTGMFKACKKLILIGAGMYPYSMFDIHKKYKHIQDGCDYDYTDLAEDDLVFISCDVDSKKIMNKVIKTCKAHIFICAPYEKTWLRSLIQNVKVTKHTGVTSYSD